MSGIGKSFKKLYRASLSFARNPTDTMENLSKGKIGSITEDPKRNRKQASRRRLAYGTVLDGSLQPVSTTDAGKQRFG